MIAVSTALYFYSFATGYRLPTQFSEYQAGTGLDHFDFVGLLLADSVGKLIRINRRDRYISTAGQGAPLRGKPDFSNVVYLEALPQYIKYQFRKLELPIQEYAFISLAIAGLLRHESVANTTKQRLRSYLSFLPPPSPSVFQLETQLRPRDQFGRELSWSLALAALINREIDLEVVGGHIPFLDFMLTRLEEGELFKRYVAGFLSKKLGSKFNVTQEKQLEWSVDGSSSLVTLVPRQRVDVYAAHDLGTWVIEVKSGASVLRNQWGAEKLNSDHLRQLFSYLYLTKKLTYGHLNVSGALIFNDQKLQPGEIDFEGFRILLCPIDLEGDWSDIESRMCWLVDKLASSFDSSEISPIAKPSN